MRFVVIGVLLAFLAGAIFVGHHGWVSAGDVTMPPWGWLMMGLGIFFTVVVGGSLMVLIFYSCRAGYDEAPQIEYDAEPEGESDFAPTRGRYRGAHEQQAQVRAGQRKAARQHTHSRLSRAT
jgi:hypothetical protein